jgi:hypothetical protein
MINALFGGRTKEIVEIVRHLESSWPFGALSFGTTAAPGT